MSDLPDPTHGQSTGAEAGDLPAYANASGEAIGQVIGPYKLLELLGEGGMGSVWMAQQSQPVKRRVALKIIKLGMDTREVVARFEVERQALALMDHPHIAKVLDAGVTEAGRPYFVMELVRGVPITTYCDQAKQDLHERLELFIKVCHAIQHAHQKGIIHRDVKPSNILVSMQGDMPLPKVIDFGIAKATGAELTQRTLNTQYGQIIGTPECMAPEQAESGGLDIDTRADVYSLGVLLYELLTGTKPFDLGQVLAAGMEELLRTIREVDPAKPSTRISSMGESASSIAVQRRVDTTLLNKRLRGDLDWIVMKALEKDRTRRYETASGFAADIQHYLNDEPVEAAPPSASYRLRKLLRRRKKTVLSVAVIFVLLIAGSVGTGIGWWKTQAANRSLDIALGEKAAALAQEEEQRLLAEDNARRARQAEAQAQAEALRATQAEARTQARADELEQVAAFQAEQLSGLDVERMGSRLRAAFIDAAPSEEQVEWTQRLATVNFTNLALGSLRDNLFERTVEAIDKQFVKQPLVQAKLLQTTATTLADLGLLGMASDPQERALAIRRQVLGDEHSDTLHSINIMGNLLKVQGKLWEAEPYYREALEGSRRLWGDEHPDTLISINNLGALLHAQDKLSEVESYYREALDGQRRVLGDEHPDTLRSINNLGTLLQEQGRFSEAEPYYREALDGLRRLLGDEHPFTLTSINNMGFQLLAQSKLSEAEPYFREALDGNRRVLGDEHPSTLASIYNMGTLLQAEGKLSEAELFYREALEGSRRVLGDEHRSTLTSISDLQSLLNAMVKAARESGSELRLAEALLKQGDFQLSQGLFREAEGTLTEALDFLFAEVPEGDPRPWQAQASLAAAFAGQGRFWEAESMILEAAQALLKDGASATPGDPKLAAMGHVLQQLTEFYAAWHVSQPGQGYDSKAANWQAKLDDWTAAQPAGGAK